MKYLTFSFLILVLTFNVQVNAQGESSNTASKPCEQYKIGILTPTKDIDFKVIIIVPPKDIDQRMVLNLCSEQHQIASVPQIILRLRETNEFFKVPTFTIKTPHGSATK